MLGPLIVFGDNGFGVTGWLVAGPRYLGPRAAL